MAEILRVAIFLALLIIAYLYGFNAGWHRCSRAIRKAAKEALNKWE